jgi:hypothetical protein
MVSPFPYFVIPPKAGNEVARGQSNSGASSLNFQLRCWTPAFAGVTKGWGWSGAPPLCLRGFVRNNLALGIRIFRLIDSSQPLTHCD